MKRKAFWVTVGLLMLSLPVSAATVQLVDYMHNTGFDTPVTQWDGNIGSVWWRQVGAEPSSTYYWGAATSSAYVSYVTFADTSIPNTPSQTISFDIWSGAVNVGQDLSGLTLENGNTYVVSFKVRIDPSNSVIPDVYLGFYSGGEVGKTQIDMTGISNTGWLDINYSYTHTGGSLSNPALVMWGSSGTHASLLIDSFSTAVPEPASLACFAICGIVSLIRRKK
jgi:hypothetical protein